MRWSLFQVHQDISEHPKSKESIQEKENIKKTKGQKRRKMINQRIQKGWKFPKSGNLINYEQRENKGKCQKTREFYQRQFEYNDSDNDDII